MSISGVDCEIQVVEVIQKLLVGVFKYFIFSPLFGEMIQFWSDHIVFQMGWFNHHLEKFLFDPAQMMFCLIHVAAMVEDFYNRLSSQDAKLILSNRNQRCLQRFCFFVLESSHSAAVDGRNPVNNGLNYPSKGAGFLPSNSINCSLTIVIHL